MTIMSWEFESPSLHAFAYQFCGNSSVGRAQPCQGWGREFESRFPLSSQEEGHVTQWACPSFLLVGSRLPSMGSW